MLFKDISYVGLWQPLCSAGRNRLCNFVHVIMRNISVKLFSILTSGSGEEEMPLKDISSSGSPFIQWSGTICEILVEGIMRSISVIFF